MVYHEERDGKPMEGLICHHSTMPTACTICGNKPPVYAWSHAQQKGESMPSQIAFEKADAPPPSIMCGSCAAKLHGYGQAVN